MGNVQPGSGLNPGDASGGALELRSGVQSNFYPWKEIIEYVYNKANAVPATGLSRELLIQILEGIDPQVRDLTEGSNVDICDKLGLEGTFQPPTDWALALLKQIPTLQKARYEIVPRFIEEESFWSRYFSQILYIVQDELEKHGIHVEDTKLADEG
ncbi:unnamed protein product [Amoebophrya sp. A25]|nr:unnamed protein product [Amoebophrya sp. A25]|eukprot:GSA25T00018353001.1